MKFDVVHFHSLYYVGLETALKLCYEKELGAKGLMLCDSSDEDSALVKYGRTFSSQGLILTNPAAFYSSKDVTDVAKKNDWKYVECLGKIKTCDISAIFDRTSRPVEAKSNLMLDYLMHWVDVAVTASHENLQKILNCYSS